ncbi:hypothetical protein J5N97_024386 [Dioscorea zingiberensis]|uniref:Vacuolar ATPase assembly protein VMA22 n=1 Tax=Dioscorea zingiberensis TaxID=325984 RepID=A0A9D5C7A7_9LILI|nr:hypothetical protein J5N97_024386 [Dioscorea zingiberensis]
MEESIQTIDNGGGEEGEIATLRFLDSLDAYVSLLNSLSSTLRQGWLELASARHSMGSSRISSALFDLKVQSASTTCQVTDSSDGSPSDSPHFTLSKWVSSREGKCSGEELTQLQKESSSSKLRHRGAPNSSDGVDDANSAINDSHSTVGNIIQKERSKSLSVFGALVPPKLRAAQGSFETALDIIVELANMRASMLSSYSQVQQEMAEIGDSS